LSVPPFDDSSLLVYVPQICAPDIIREAVSGIVATHGDALDAIVTGLADPDEHALLALPDPAWSDAAGGILAYGECPQIVGHVGNRNMTVRVNVMNAVDCVLFECGGMRLTCVPAVGGWRAAVIVYKVGTTITLPTTTILDEGTAYVITATHELATGNITILVDGVEDNLVGGTDDVNIIAALPIWRVGAPPESWITDCAMFDAVVPAGVPGPIDILGAKLLAWWDGDDPSDGTRPADGALVYQWKDKTGNSHVVESRNGLATGAPYQTNVINGNGVMRFNGTNDGYLGAGFMYANGGIEIWFVTRSDESGTGCVIAEGGAGLVNAAYRVYDDDIPNAYAFNLDNEANVTRFTNSQDRSTNDWDLVVVRDTGAAGGTSVEVVDVDAGTTGAYTRDAMSLTQLAVGFIRRHGSDAQFFDGDIADILVLSSAATGGERTALAAYFNDKYDKTWSPA
jgi:hypothetical protein